LQEWLHADPVWRLLLVIGFLGGFTTFSSFSWDTYTLWMNAKHGLAVLNVLANLTCSLVGTALGVWLARYMQPFN
jgi:fluoride exporter